MVAQSCSLTKKPGTPRLPVGESHNRTDKSSQRFSCDTARQRVNNAVSEAAGDSAPAADVPQRPTFQLEKTITVKEAAYRAGKSPAAIHDWLRTGRLRGWQPGGRGCHVMVVEDSLLEALCLVPLPRVINPGVKKTSGMRKNAGLQGQPLRG